MMNIYGPKHHSLNDKPIANYLPNNLRVLRQRLELSQQDLADRIGLNRGNIASYENGSAEPRICNLLKISKFFSISILDLTEQDLCEEVNLQEAGERFRHISEGERQLIEGFSVKVGEMERFLESLHHCYKYKTSGLAEPSREIQLLMSYIDQMHEAAMTILRQHRDLLDFVQCRMK